MNEHPIGTVMAGQEACQARVWTHSVGIINTIRDVDKDTRTDQETNGTASLGCWGVHHFLLTANHVIHPDAKCPICVSSGGPTATTSIWQIRNYERTTSLTESPSETRRRAS